MVLQLYQIGLNTLTTKRFKQEGRELRIAE